MLNKIEAKYIAWHGIVDRHREAFASTMDLWALGCPDEWISELAVYYGIPELSEDNFD